MDYGKLQAKRYLNKGKRNNHHKNKKNKSSWEQKEKLKNKKRQIKKHQQYMVTKERKLNQYQTPMFKDMNIKAYKIAKKQHGIISIKQIHNLVVDNYLIGNYFEPPFNFKFYHYLYIWLKYQSNNPHAYIRPYTKEPTKKSVHCFLGLCNGGFIDSQGIKNELKINNTRKANRILKPITKTKLNANHLPADELFKVSHLTQATYLYGKPVIRNYGVNKPVTVVNRYDYSRFIHFDYNTNHLTPKYAKTKLSSFGQELYSLYHNSTSQNQTKMFMKLAIRNILNKTKLDESLKLNKYTKLYLRGAISNKAIKNYVSDCESLIETYHFSLELLIANDGLTNNPKYPKYNRIRKSKWVKDVLRNVTREIKRLKNIK